MRAAVKINIHLMLARNASSELKKQLSFFFSLCTSRSYTDTDY